MLCAFTTLTHTSTHTRALAQTHAEAGRQACHVQHTQIHLMKCMNTHWGPQQKEQQDKSAHTRRGPSQQEGARCPRPLPALTVQTGPSQYMDNT